MNELIFVVCVERRKQMFGIIPQGYFQTFVAGSFEGVFNLFLKLEITAEAMASFAELCVICLTERWGISIFLNKNSIMEV